MKKIFMTSLVLTILAASITLVQMASCTKATSQPNEPGKCPPAIYPVAGLWEDTYQTDQVNHVPTSVSFSIYPDGTFLRRSKVVNSTEYALFQGRWTLTGDVFQYRDTAILYSVGNQVDIGTLIFSNNGTFSSGGWSCIAGRPGYSGTFQNMKRIN